VHRFDFELILSLLTIERQEIVVTRNEKYDRHNQLAGVPPLALQISTFHDHPFEG
jgi:hypothetical protein